MISRAVVLTQHAGHGNARDTLSTFLTGSGSKIAAETAAVRYVYYSSGFCYSDLCKLSSFFLSVFLVVPSSSIVYKVRAELQTYYGFLT